MDWVPAFYSTTGKWWGPAEGKITDRDHDRVQVIHENCGDGPKAILELGAGYGTTAAVTADAGHKVVALEISDRIDFARKFEQRETRGSLKFVRGDFYTAKLQQEFDVVCYWNGFGIGDDADQRRLLRRISGEWLKPMGKALIDVGNPFVRSAWAGDLTSKPARPEAGYEHGVGERTDYDPVTNRFVDTWWIETEPGDRVTQTLRCYAPADLALLLEGTGLELTSIFAGRDRLDTTGSHVGYKGLLKAEQEYLAVLERIESPPTR